MPRPTSAAAVGHRRRRRRQDPFTRCSTMFRIARKLLASGLAVCASAGISLAQGPAAASPNDDVQALKAFVLQQHKQIDALTQRISTPVATTEAMDAKTVRSIVADYMQETGK